MRHARWLFLAALVGCSQPVSVSGIDEPLLPQPARGLQLNVGPFEVPPGEEVQICQTLKLSNDEPIAINRVEMKKRVGSHHTILFASDIDVPDQTFPCWGTINFDDWRFVVDSQSEDFDWKLPEGKAYVFQPHQQVMIQAHYQNAAHTKAPGGGYVTINLDATDVPADAPSVAYGMFTVNRRIDLPPHSHGVTFTRDCVLDHNAYLFGIYGHYHSRGRSFTVDHYSVPHGDTIDDNSRDLIEHLYTSTDWENMKFLESPSAEMPGDGRNGILVGTGESIRYSCTYDNDSDGEIVFGSHADVQEHCNLFFHYAIAPNEGYVPVAPGTHLTCLNGGGSW